MTPKEKAEELAMKFDKYSETDNAIKCALIAINEIIDYLVSSKITGTLMTYWQEVKNEITSHKV